MRTFISCNWSLLMTRSCSTSSFWDTCKVFSACLFKYIALRAICPCITWFFFPSLLLITSGTLNLILLRWQLSVNNNVNYFQFFITLGDDLDYLDGVHTVFAEVVEGFDILDKLNDAICDDDNRPYQDIRLATVIVYIE